MKSKINHGQRALDTPSPPVIEKTDTVDLAMQTAAAQKQGEIINYIIMLSVNQGTVVELSHSIELIYF